MDLFTLLLVNSHRVQSALKGINLNLFQWDTVEFIYITIDIGDLWTLLYILLEYGFIEDGRDKAGR